MNQQENQLPAASDVMALNAPEGRRRKARGPMFGAPRRPTLLGLG